MFITNFLSKKTDEYNSRHQLSFEQYDQMVTRFEEDLHIAKHIFQICLFGNGSSANEALTKLPPEFVENIEKLKKNNPDYDYSLYSDKEACLFIKEHYGDLMLSYYQRIDNTYLAAKADFLRYLLLYAYGGSI